MKRKSTNSTLCKFREFCFGAHFLNLHFPLSFHTMDTKPSDTFAESMLDWAVRDLQYQPEGKYSGGPLPSITDLKKLCRGHTNNIWSFLVNNVHSKTKIQNIRANIEINQSLNKLNQELTQSANVAKSLKARKEELQNKVAQVRSSNCKLEYEIERLQSEAQAESKTSSFH